MNLLKTLMNIIANLIEKDIVPIHREYDTTYKFLINDDWAHAQIKSRKMWESSIKELSR